jgi:hypothetical protein
LMKKEFRLVELLGGVIGFVIGCLQVLLVIWDSKKWVWNKWRNFYVLKN